MATETGNTHSQYKAASADADTGASSGVGAEAKRSLRKKAEMPPELDRLMQDLASDSGANGAGTLARVERRLGILEAAFADIVERHESSLRDRSAQLAGVQENLLALNNRFDEAGELHGNAVSGLRTALAELSVRMNGLEAQPHAAAADSLPQPQEDVEYETPAPAWPSEIEVAAAEPSPAPQEPPAPMRASEGPAYLAAARRAALASISETETPGRIAAELPRRSNRARLLAAACAAPLLLLAVAGIMVYRHPVTANTMPTPPALTATAAQQAKTAEAAAAKTPPPAVDVAAPIDPTAAETASASPVHELQEKASHGDAHAARDLGLKYLTGDGIGSSDDDAARWLLKAAYAGEPEAEYWLGTLYARGRGVPEDESQALHWYESAAKQGNSKAMHRLGILYFEGQGVTRNEAEAARWFAQAAQIGSLDSAFNLAVLYERGAGVKQSLTEAYTWYAIAARAGDKEATSRVETLAKQLKPADVTAAAKAAVEFKPKTKEVVSRE